MQEVYTDYGCYLPSEREDVIEALQTYCNGKTFLDLGSGDGRVVEWARQCGAVNPRGVELDSMATDIKGNIFEHDITEYEVLFYYSGGSRLEYDLLNWIKIKYKGILLLNEGVIENNLGLPRLTILSDTFITLGKTKIFNFI